MLQEQLAQHCYLEAWPLQLLQVELLVLPRQEACWVLQWVKQRHNLGCLCPRHFHLHRLDQVCREVVWLCRRECLELS